MACELKDMQSFNLQPIVSRHQCSLYVPQKNHQIYVPENIVLPQKDTHNSEVGLAPGSHIAMSQTAAYWAAVASEDREGVGSCEETEQSARSFLGDTYLPVSTVSTISYPSLQENSGQRTSHASEPLHYQMYSHGGMHLPPPSAVRFSDNLQLLCPKPQGLPLDSARVEAGPLPLPYLTRTVSHMSAPQNNENGVNMLTTCTYTSQCDGLASAAEALRARYLQVPPQTSLSSYGYAHSLLAPGYVAYGDGYNSSQGALITYETSQAHYRAPSNAAADSRYSQV